MKIKFDYQIFGIQHYGGISKYFYYLSKELNKLNENALIISPFYINKTIKGKKFVIGTYINTKSRYLIRALKYLNMFFDFIFVSINSYNIIHKTYYSVITGSKSSKKAKSVITVYDMTHELYPSYFKDSIKVSKKKLDACIQADKIICISKSTKKDLVRLFKIDKEKIKVIYLGVDNNIFFNSTYKSKQTESIGEYILYVGPRSGYKNFDTLLNAYIKYEKINKNYKLILFGGEQKNSRELNIIKKHGLANNVIYCAGNDQYLSELYNNAFVFVHTSLYEGFGLTILEAMACGCPVIAFNTSSIPEVSGKAALLLEDVSDVNEIGKAIINLDQNSEYRSRLIKEGIKNAKEFSWNKCAKETLEIYNKLNKIEKTS